MTDRKIFIVTETNLPDGYFVDRIIGTFDSLRLAFDFLVDYVPRFNRNDFSWDMVLWEPTHTEVLDAQVGGGDRRYFISQHEHNKGSSIGPDIEQALPTLRKNVTGTVGDIKQLVAELLHDTELSQ